MAGFLKFSLRGKSCPKVFLCQNKSIPGKRNYMCSKVLSISIFNSRLSIDRPTLWSQQTKVLASTPNTFLPHRGTALHNSIFARFAQTASQSERLKYVMSKEYNELYLIRSISFVRILCRFAKYSSLALLVGTPSLFGMAQVDMMSPQTAVNIGFLLAFYALLFTGQSLLFTSRLVGKIMISSDEEFVKVSHLSVFGDRRDIYVKPSDVVPLLDKGDVFSKNIQTLQFKNFPKKLFFLPHHGGIDTNFEALEILLTGGFSKSSKT